MHGMTVKEVRKLITSKEVHQCWLSVRVSGDVFRLDTTSKRFAREMFSGLDADMLIFAELRGGRLIIGQQTI